MGVFADVTGEFKQAKPQEKTLIIIGVVVVLGVAYYLYSKQQATGSQAAPLQPGGPTTQPPRAGYPETSQGTPTVPFGTNPIYDQSGNLVGWQSPNPNNQQPGPGPGTPSPSPTNWLGHIPLFSHVQPGGFDQNGQRFWFVSPGSQQQQLFYLPKGSTVTQGGAGRWWYTLPGQQQQLLTGPPSPTTPQPIATSGQKSTPGG